MDPFLNPLDFFHVSIFVQIFCLFIFKQTNQIFLLIPVGVGPNFDSRLHPMASCGVYLNFLQASKVKKVSNTNLCSSFSVKIPPNFDKTAATASSTLVSFCQQLCQELLPVFLLCLRLGLYRTASQLKSERWICRSRLVLLKKNI